MAAMTTSTCNATAAVAAGAASCGCSDFHGDKETTGRTLFALQRRYSASHDFALNPDVTGHRALNFSSMAGVRGSKSSKAILGDKRGSTVHCMLRPGVARRKLC